MESSEVDHRRYPQFYPDDSLGSDLEEHLVGKAIAAFRSSNFDKFYRIVEGHKFKSSSHGVSKKTRYFVITSFFTLVLIANNQTY